VIKIGNTQLDTIIARTPEEQAQGLSDLESLPENKCLVFPFSTTLPKHLFNTTKMLFPIDIICIRDKKIIYIEKNVEKGKIMIVLPSSSFIIEINAGICDKNKWTVGMMVYGFDGINK